MYEFKNTEGQKQSPIDQYFNRTKHDGELSINQVSDYIGSVPTGVYVREPIAYAFKKAAMELGHEEPVRFNQLSFGPRRVPFNTNYIYDNTLPLTMEEVRREGINRHYVGGFEVPMYGKVPVGDKIEISQDVIEVGADELIAIGTKPWVNVLQPNYVAKNYATTILVGDIPKSPQTVSSLDIPLELQQTAMGAGFEVRDALLTQGEKYTITFEYQATQGGINDIHSYSLGYEGTNIYIDNELIAEFGYLPASKWVVGGGKHTYYMHFTKADDGNVFSWQFNYETYTQPTKVWITNLNIYEGHVHPFREDLELLPIQGTVWQNRTRTEVIPFQTTTVDKPELLPSQSRVEVVGKTGSRTYAWTVEVIDGVETGNKTPEVQTEYVAPVNQVYWQGTKEGDGTLGVINIADRGAVYNDPTHDNKPLLHSIMDELHAIGGGTIEFPDDKGVLYTSADIYVSSGITLQGIGDRPVIKLMPSVDEYWSMFHLDNKEDINMYNLTVDTNKTEREASGNLGDLSTPHLAQVAISMGDDSANINISNNKIIGNGIWVIACHTGQAHPSNISITENDIFWSMGYATQNADVPQGVSIDNTWVYFDAVDYEFIGNTLNSDTPSANMTAIEAHGANGIVRGNSVRNARTGIIPWNIVNDTTDRVINDILIEENEFIDVLNGVDIGLTPHFNFTNLIVRDNNIELNPNNFPGSLFSRGIIIGSWSAVNGEISENFTIENNYISSKPFEINHGDSTTNFEYYYNYFGIGVISGIYKNLKIQNNTISDLPSFGIMIQNEYQKQVKIETGTVVDNIVENVMKSQTNRSPLVGSALHIMQRADTIVSGLTFGVNYIVDTRSTVDTWYDEPTTLPDTPNIAEQEVSETKDVPEDAVVFDSRNETVNFTMNSANNYLNNFSTLLEANTEYYLETNYPTVLWITNDLNNPMMVEVWGGTSQVITTDFSRIFGVVASPPVDLDGTVYEYNSTQFEDKTYYFVIYKSN